MRGSNESQSTFTAQAPGNIIIAQAVPGAPTLVDPIINLPGNSQGDTVYFLLESPFACLASQTINTSAVGSARYSTYTPLYDYVQIVVGIIMRNLFAKRPGRAAPNLSVIADMIQSIEDITRMLGIYMSGLSCMQSRDPEMFQRAYDFNLVQTLGAMQRVLANLPLPANIVRLCVKYIRLMDISASALYQNVGFLTSGDYSAFLTLDRNVGSRIEALGWLRALYPEIGMIADPGSATDADVSQAFANATHKLLASTDNYTPYVIVDGASGEPAALASAGVLQANFYGTTYQSLTAYAAPGSGTGGVASVRQPYPTICTYSRTVLSDAVYMRTKAPTNYSNAAGVVQFQTIQNSDLCANIGHEYNMSSAPTSPAVIVGEVTIASGASTGAKADTLTAEDTRYRVSAGMGLAGNSSRLDANTITLLYSMYDVMT